MKEIVLILVSIGLLILFIFVVLYIRLLLIAKERTQESINALKGEKILLSEKAANFFGHKSAKVKQIRGNGFLALTDKKIYFKMWLPNKTLIIPLTSIIEVQKVNAFLGKTKAKPLLKIIFYRNNGLRDEVAWLVQEPEKWIFRINKLLRNL